jgi:hypothetical protein
VYFDTFWVRVLMFFYLILRRFRFVFESSSINCQTLVSFFASTRYRRRHSWKSERFYNFFWLFEIASEMIERCWRDWQKNDTSSWEEIVFYEKYRELASHSCQTKDSWDAWSEFEFWEKIISFFFVCCNDRFYVDTMIFFIDWLISYIRFVSSSRSMRLR